MFKYGVFSGPHFTTFRLNLCRLNLRVNLRIQSEYEIIPKKNGIRPEKFRIRLFFKQFSLDFRQKALVDFTCSIFPFGQWFTHTLFVFCNVLIFHLACLIFISEYFNDYKLQFWILCLHKFSYQSICSLITAFFNQIIEYYNQITAVQLQLNQNILSASKKSRHGSTWAFYGRFLE